MPGEAEELTVRRILARAVVAALAGAWGPAALAQAPVPALDAGSPPPDGIQFR